MRERVLAIVNLIAKYVLGAKDAPINEQELVAELMSVGFDAEEINDAFSWMETVSLQNTAKRSIDSVLQTPPTYRLFTPEEQQVLTTEGIGFLTKIRSMGLLSDELQEEIIDRAVRAAEDPLSLQEVKMIAALTMLSRADSLWQREIDCFLDNDWARIYH